MAHRRERARWGDHDYASSISSTSSLELCRQLTVHLESPPIEIIVLDIDSGIEGTLLDSSGAQ
jgi:hypothetical protein